MILIIRIILSIACVFLVLIWFLTGRKDKIWTLLAGICGVLNGILYFLF